MKESQPIPAIAVSLATSLVAAPYLLIRNYITTTRKSPLSIRGRLLSAGSTPAKQSNQSRGPRWE